MPAKRSVILLFQQALALDAAGRDREAISLYRRAIAQGLSKPNLRTALICLGSSLRNTGDFRASIRTLQKARSLYPRDVAIMLFLALAHYDAGQRNLAFRQLGDALLGESKQKQLGPFRKSLSRKYHAVR